MASLSELLFAKIDSLRELELQNKFRGLIISTLVVTLIIALILSTCLR